MEPSDFVHPGQRVALVMAAGVTRPTLAPSLSRRSWKDQGLITGLATGTHYLVTLAAQDLLDVVAHAAAGTLPFPDAWPDDRRQVTAALASELVATPLGLGVAAYLDRSGVSTPAKGLMRQAAWRVGATALCGSVLIGATAGARVLDRRLGAGGRIAGLPLAIPVGLLTSAVIERARRSTVEEAPTEEFGAPDEAAADANPLWLLPAGGLVLTTLYGAGWAERWTAAQVRRLAPGSVAGSGLAWRLASHAVFLAGADVLVSALWTRAMQRIEAGTTSVDPWMRAATGVWTIDGPSGDPASLVSWDSLGREGRRHAVTYVRPERPAVPRTSRRSDPAGHVDRDGHGGARPGPPDPGVRRPRQRGHADRAGGPRDRGDGPDGRVVALAAHARVADGHRLRQLRGDGQGEYLTLWDCCQRRRRTRPRKRPSPLSLGKVRDAREQNRLLWLRILQRVRDMPSDRRPKVVLFGESLGAHTSQDVLLGWGRWARRPSGSTGRGGSARRVAASGCTRSPEPRDRTSTPVSSPWSTTTSSS